MNDIIFIGIGGCLGAVSRFLVSKTVSQYFPHFPYGTLTVNIIGSLLLGFVSYSIMYGKDLSPELRGLITVGFIGSFTTMSTFAFETVRIFDIGETSAAFLNIAANLMFCLVAVMTGRFLAVILFK